MFCTLSPAFDRRGKRLHRLLDARLQGKAMLLCRSHRLLLDSARVLIGRASDPANDIAMMHEVKPDVIPMTSAIGIVAQSNVKSDRLHLRQEAPPRPTAAAPMRFSGAQGPRTASTTACRHEGHRSPRSGAAVRRTRRDDDNP